MARPTNEEANNPRKRPMQFSIRLNRITDGRMAWLMKELGLEGPRQVIEEAVKKYFLTVRRRKGQGELSLQELEKYTTK